MTDEEQMYICPHAEGMACVPGGCIHAERHYYNDQCKQGCHIRDEELLMTEQCIKCNGE